MVCNTIAAFLKCPGVTRLDGSKTLPVPSTQVDLSQFPKHVGFKGATGTDHSRRLKAAGQIAAVNSLQCFAGKIARPPAGLSEPHIAQRIILPADVTLATPRPNIPMAQKKNGTLGRA
jgi:hypothetical protein